MNQIFYALLLILITTSAFAQITTYSDLTLWEADAIDICGSEDFEGFTMDTEFRTAPLQLNGFSLRRSVGTFEFRNLIETPPFRFNDNNGTKHASMYVDSDAPTEVVMDFDNPISGFIAEFTAASDGEILALMYDSEGGMMSSHTFTMNNSSFGFILPKASVSSIKFTSTTSNGLRSGEGFSLDNVVLACGSITMVPTMGQWAKMILALALSSLGVGYLANTNRPLRTS